MKRWYHKRSRPAATLWRAACGQRLEQAQRKLAGCLNRRTQYWNRSSWIIALAVFCLLFGACCAYLIGRVLWR